MKNSTHFRRTLAITLVCLASSTMVFAQHYNQYQSQSQYQSQPYQQNYNNNQGDYIDRQQIKNAINKYEYCRILSLTEGMGDAAILKTNGYSTLGCSEKMRTDLAYILNRNYTIDDVHISESGSWVIVYGKNGFEYEGIPQTLLDKLNELNKLNKQIISVSFNTSGEWVVVTTTEINSSHQTLLDWVVRDMGTKGQVRSTFLSRNLKIVLYENGYSVMGRLPWSLQNALNSTFLEVNKISVAGNSWFFADAQGYCQYEM